LLDPPDPETVPGEFEEHAATDKVTAAAKKAAWIREASAVEDEG
jgi:hypothetical protein